MNPWLIVFYVVTSLLAYLLTPKPKVQAPSTSAPTPQQGAAPPAKTTGAVPVVFGTVWVTPNVVWYGDLGVEPIQECVSSRGGRKK